MSPAPQPHPTSGDEFQQTYIDVDEARSDPAPHRYVHGGFAGTDTRFSYYFPESPDYAGRFFHHITPTPDSEHLGTTKPGGFNKVGLALANGVSFVESNGGGHGVGVMDADPTIGAFRASAAVASHSRLVAAAGYGQHRPFGYAYGGSGGAYRTTIA